MMWGDMSPVKPEVGVPLLKPQEQGVVAVEIIAPATPGKLISILDKKKFHTKFQTSFEL